jgi:hypothetical protein
VHAQGKATTIVRLVGEKYIWVVENVCPDVRKREEKWTVETLRYRSGEQPITIGSCKVARQLRLGASTHEVAKCEMQGGESEPLNPGTGGPLDQNSMEILYTRILEVRRLEGATFDRRSQEVLRVEARENTWYIH